MSDLGDIGIACAEHANGVHARKYTAKMTGLADRSRMMESAVGDLRARQSFL
jgi:hypothetical protein